MSQPYVCPATLSGSLDNFLRRLLHKPEMILKPYINNGMVVLDMGCGPGYFTPEMARLAGEEGRVIAADLQQAMLDLMIKKITGLGLEKRVEPHLCQSETIGINTKVGFILLFWMVHEVPDQLKFFKELRMILNPDGKILIAEPKIHVTKRAFSAMTEKLESAGFQIYDRPSIAISRCLVLTSGS